MGANRNKGSNDGSTNVLGNSDDNRGGSNVPPQGEQDMKKFERAYRFNQMREEAEYEAMEWLADNVFVDVNFKDRDSRIFLLGKANTITLPVTNFDNNDTEITDRYGDHFVINGWDYLELNEKQSIHDITLVLNWFHKHLYSRKELTEGIGDLSRGDVIGAIVRIVKDLVFSMGTHNHGDIQMRIMTNSGRWETDRWGHRFGRKW